MNNEMLLEIAEQYGTPTYVYDLEKAREQIRKLKEAFTYSNTSILYALKANFNPHLVQEILSQGLGIDATSPEEVNWALMLGADKNSVMFTGNSMSDSDMREVHEKGVLLNIDSKQRLKDFGEKYSGSAVCIRINPNIGDGSHSHTITGGEESKFGIPYQEIEQAVEIARNHHIRIVGIHHHIGSGWLNMDSPLQALEIILEAASKIEGLKFVDIGGGYGIPYKPEEEELDMFKLGERMSNLFGDFSNRYYQGNLELRMEPGRFIVAQAGSLLTQVTTLKTNPGGRNFAGTDTGMNHLIRVALYEAYHGIENVSNPLGELVSYFVNGNVCESSDFFNKESRKLPQIRVGDILRIRDAGAYGDSMGSNYQMRLKPAEVIVGGDRHFLSRRRIGVTLSSYETEGLNLQSQN